MSTSAHSTENAATQEQSPRGLRKVILGGGIGNAVEWFDYSMYGYLAATIGVLFFPSEDDTASLLSAFAVFAVAFAIRPLGGLFFGSIGDRIGRRSTLSTVVLLISASTFLVGLLPSYATIGIGAPILLLLLRLLQGFSAGGEVAGSTSLLAEYAPDKRRGFVVGFQNISAFAGALLGSVVVTVMTYGFGQDAMQDWGWRIPFLIAGPLGLAGLFIRLRLEETPEFLALSEDGEVSNAPLREAIRDNLGGVVRCAGLAVTHAIGYYTILAYLPNFLLSKEKVEAGEAFLVTCAALVTAIVVLPFASALSDRIGRRKVAIAASVGYLVFAYPVFMLMSSGGLMNALLGQVILGVLFGTFGSAPFAMMVEMFPTRVRYSAASVGYNVAIAAFGGTAPFIATWLVERTDNELSPAWYLMGGALLSLIAAVRTAETAGKPLRAE